MPYRSASRVRPVPSRLGLILCMAGLPASRVEAQSTATEHRLTESMVRQVSAVMREWNPTPDLADQMFVTANIGMPKEKFEALPDSQQVKILIESTTRAKAKYREGEQQIYTLMNGTAADGVKAVERIPALKAALGKHRLSAREFIPAYRAYHWAMGYVLGEEFGPGKPLPPGVRQENVTLFRAMSKSEPLWTLLGLSKS